jgi:hypothetical protein
VAVLPHFIPDMIASGDAAGAGQIMYRMFQGEWGGRATLATIEALNTLVVQAGCRMGVRASFAGAVVEVEGCCRVDACLPACHPAV